MSPFGTNVRELYLYQHMVIIAIPVEVLSSTHQLHDLVMTVPTLCPVSFQILSSVVSFVMDKVTY